MCNPSRFLVEYSDNTKIKEIELLTNINYENCN